MTHFSRKSLSVAIAAMLGVGLLSTTANALTIKDFTPPATTATPSAPLKYASEITRDEGKILVNPANLLDLVVDVGFGFSAGIGLYPRIDFDGAKVAIKPVAKASVASTTAIPATDPSGGSNIGESFVIYSLTAPTGGVLDSDNLTLALDATGPLSLASGATRVTAEYVLYGSSTGAANKNPNEKLSFQPPFEMLNFSTSAITFSADISASEPKIDVGQNSKKFDNGKNLVALGKLTHKETADVYLLNGTKAADTAQVEIASATGSQLIVEGDFSASAPTLSNVFLSDMVDCSSSKLAAKTLSPTTATWQIDNKTVGEAAGLAAGTDVYVCMNTNGTTEILGGTYSATYKPTAAAGYTVPSTGIKVDLETLQRNGVVLVSPMVNSAPIADYATRIMITNESGKDASMTMSVIKDKDGTLALVAGKETAVIPAQGAILLKMEEITTGNRGAIIFQINGPSGLIHGIYRIRAVGSDSFDSYPLLERTTQ